MFSHTALITHQVPYGLERLQVHVWFRHGEKYFGKERNEMCWPTGGYPIEEPPRGCIGEGDLSAQGRARMLRFGNQLRSALIERDKFLRADAAVDKEDVFLWVCKPGDQRDRPSTTNQRHWESLREVCRGLWPQDNRPLQSLNVQGPIDSMERMTAHVGYTQAQKKRIEELHNTWDKFYASDSFAVCARDCINSLLQDPIQAGRRDAVHDLQMRMMCSAAHGEPLPPGVTMEDYQDLARADLQGWAHGNRCSDSELGRLVLGRVVCSLADSMARAAGDKPLLDVMCQHMGSTWGRSEATPKLFLWSATDGHLAPLAAALKIPYASFPRFGSYLMFELFRRRTDGKILLRVTRDSEMLRSFLHLKANPDGLFVWAQCFEMMRRLCRD